jgi:hypothetical protein
MPSVSELESLRIVLTPPAKEVFPDGSAVRARIATSIPEPDELLPEEIVLWRGENDDRIVALINRYVRTIYVERFGVPGSDIRQNEAIRNVNLRIGSRPDLPSGAEYVRRIRGIWRGLLPRERA